MTWLASLKSLMHASDSDECTALRKRVIEDTRAARLQFDEAVQRLAKERAAQEDRAGDDV